MLKQIKKIILTVLAALLLSLSAGTALVLAQSNNTNIQGSLCTGSKGGFSGTESTDSCNFTQEESDLNPIIATVINIFSVVVGVVAVIMIIYGGFRYITSGGDSGHITTAKNTILYAIVGLVIVALAQFIVKFVLARAATN